MPLMVRRKDASGGWSDVREIHGPLNELATLPDGDYLLWDYDVLLGEFSVTRD